MRLAEFILQEMEAILVEWESFAASLFPAARNATQLTLRDHAQQILEAVAKDLSTQQTRQEQAEKSKGHAPKTNGAPNTAAETHAILRARSGFEMNQLIAEYRALRASVLRQWMDTRRLEIPDLNDVIRFNEAIDQAIAESVAFFSAELDQARNLLLGMLGHDMRSPLHTIQVTASYLAALNAGDGVSVAASRLIRSGASMKALLDDLVDFSRTRLGLGVNISATKVDLAAMFSDEVEQLRGAHPDRQIEIEVYGDTLGHWDGTRLQQMLRNLISNALKYGSQNEPVRVLLTGDGADIRIEVTNSGPTIDEAVLDRIFDPLRRGPDQEGNRGADGGLGLGLYIVREVASAHGGEVLARSERG